MNIDFSIVDFLTVPVATIACFMGACAVAETSRPQLGFIICTVAAAANFLCNDAIFHLATDVFWCIALVAAGYRAAKDEDVSIIK